MKNNFSIKSLMLFGFVTLICAATPALATPVPPAQPGPTSLQLSSPGVIQNPVQPATTDASWNFKAGAGYAYNPAFEGSSEYAWSPFPYFRVSWRNIVSLDVIQGLQITAFKLNNFTGRAGLAYSRARKQSHKEAWKGPDDSPFLLKPQLNLSYRWGLLEVSNTLSQELSARDGENLGLINSTELGAGFPIIQSLVGKVTGFAVVADDSHLNRQFGVSASFSERANRPVHVMSSGLKSWGATAGVQYSPVSSWTLLLSSKYERFSKAVTGSPFLSEKSVDSQWQVISGLNYNFSI